MTWTTPTNVSAGTASSAQFNTEVIANLLHLYDNLMDDWAAYTPTNTSITVGNGTQTARWVRINNTVIVNYVLTLGSTSAIGASPRVGMPIISANSDAVPSIRYTDASASTHAGGLGVLVAGAANIALLSSTGANLSSTVPFTWATSDAIRLSITYETA